MTLVDHSPSDHQGAKAQQVAAGDLAPTGQTALVLATSEAAPAAAAESDGLGMLALGLVVIGAYLARR